MSIYQHILVAVDLDESNKSVVAKAQQMAADGAVLELVHVIEPLPLYGSIPTIDFSGIHSYSEEAAKEMLTALGSEFGITIEHQHLLEGVAHKELHAFSDRQEIDLVVLGSHGRHGVSLLLGSTANAMLHGAKCDVLAVRV